MVESTSVTNPLVGTAYGKGLATSEALLTEVGPGTPCGELMRRYWQPIRATEKLGPRPEKIRILGEDLILFRDGQGRPGLLYPHCMHRGTSLFYGKIENDGIRCCYHGWKFDVEGNCLEQPCEPNGGIGRANHRQPWYPVREQYGLLWTYMGPPDKMPLMPRYEHMEGLNEDERYAALDNSFSLHADLDGPEIVRSSWLSINDNNMDPLHVYWLHAAHGTLHFGAEQLILPEVSFEEVELGMTFKSRRKLPDGRTWDFVLTWVAPNLCVNPSSATGPGGHLTIIVPVDDHHVRVFNTHRVGPEYRRPQQDRNLSKMKPWTKMTDEERQDAPNDYEAQSTQGPSGIELHSQEHMVTSDRGVAVQRRILRREIGKILDGGDPINVAFEPGTEIVRPPSGNFYTSELAA